MKCPECGSINIKTERRINGNSTCVACLHHGPSTTFMEPPTAKPSYTSALSKPEQRFKEFHMSNSESSTNNMISDGWRVVSFQMFHTNMYVLFER